MPESDAFAAAHASAPLSHNDFLLRLRDALRTISSPADTRRTAMNLLGKHLGLSRVHFFEVEAEGDGWAHVIKRGYQRDPRQIEFVGRYPLREFGSWMLAEACAYAATRGDTLSLSVAVSPRQVASGALLTQIGLALDRSGLASERLELELTEPVFLDGDIDTLLTLSAIRDLGIGLSLQGFGAGHVSLSRLKRLPLTTLKLDPSLIRDLPRDREDAAIIQGVVHTAQAMDLTVVAEGIEREAQRALLAALGCQQGQGSLYSPHEPAHH